jgi:hypothetical protein
MCFEVVPCGKYWGTLLGDYRFNQNPFTQRGIRHRKLAALMVLTYDVS